MPFNPEHLPNPLLDTPLPTRNPSSTQTQGIAISSKLRLTHLSWIFNIPILMLHRRAYEEDATQEILLKTIKARPSFAVKHNSEPGYIESPPTLFSM